MVLTSLDTVDFKLLEKAKENIREIKEKYSNDSNYDGQWLEVRESITGGCNFKCRYCTDNASRDLDKSYEFWIKLNAALAGFGLQGLHHTGGEPTIRKNFPEYVKAMKILGYKSQVLTTNGANPLVISEAIKEGITRVNISLDTLKPEKMSDISGVQMNTFEKVMESINIATEVLDLVKINTVVTRDNFDEVESLFSFAQEKGAVLRLIELYPYGPALESGKLVYQDYHVEKKSIIEKLEKFGPLKPVQVEGLNAVPKYFTVGSYKTPIAIISPNWVEGGATCGKELCRRLRVGASGNITYCNNIPEIRGELYQDYSINDIADKVSICVYKKNRRVLLQKYPSIHPFAYAKLRFGQ
jgi:cyclic pyranopterin phosphate synthase